MTTPNAGEEEHLTAEERERRRIAENERLQREALSKGGGSASMKELKARQDASASKDEKSRVMTTVVTMVVMLVIAGGLFFLLKALKSNMAETRGSVECLIKKVSKTVESPEACKEMGGEVLRQKMKL